MYFVINLIETYLKNNIFCSQISLQIMKNILHHPDVIHRAINSEYQHPHGIISVDNSNYIKIGKIDIQTLHCAMYHYCTLEEAELRKKRKKKNTLTSSVFKAVPIEKCRAFQRKVFKESAKEISSVEKSSVRCLLCHQHCLQKAMSGKIAVIPETTFL